MARTFLVEGDITAADTFTALTTRGSEAAPSVQLDAKWKKIDRVEASIAPDLTAAGSAVFILRLGGNATKNQEIVVGGAGGQLPQLGSDVAPKVTMAFELEEADIDVSGGDTITVSAAMTDTDLGTARAVVGIWGS